LVTRYIYPDLEIGDLWIFANNRVDLSDEMRSTVFQDEFLSRMLFDAGYIQFARPGGGNYDPICFGTKRQSSGGEYPIVQIDHEGILCHEKISIVKEVADSFHQFVETYLQEGVQS
jgi:hypothetical protein